jgi:hypothetical protein
MMGQAFIFTFWAGLLFVVIGQSRDRSERRRKRTSR